MYKKSSPSRLSRINGLSLIEVLVTVVITSIGLMGLVSLQMQAVRATNDSGNRSQGIWIFNDIVNRIHANEIASASYITAGAVKCDAPTNTCSSYHSGSSVIDPVVCTGEQLADWDLYEVACPLRADPIIGDSSKYLPNAELTITCVNAVCTNGDPLVVTLQWRARSDNESITGSARDANSGLITLTDVITP